MRFLLCGDAHLRETSPRYRKDLYTESQLRKMQWIQLEALMQHVSSVMWPGDFTDSPRLPNRLLSIYITLLLRDRDIFSNLVIKGQHDMKYHATIEQSALSVFLAAEALIMVNHWSMGEAQIYGCGWNEEIPKIKNLDALNILLIHRLFSTEALYPGDKDWINAEGFLKNSNWDLIVAGDNHTSFQVSVGNRHLVNCGSLMRSRKDQLDHTPCVYIYDTETRSLEQKIIPTSPIEDVMDLDQISHSEERDSLMEIFVEKIKGKAEIEGLDYIHNMEKAMNQVNSKQSIRDLWKEVVRIAGEKIKSR